MPAQFARDGKPGIQVGLNGLPNHEFLDGRDGLADEVDVFLFQPGAKQRFGDHREGHFHQLRVDIDGAETACLSKSRSESARESCMIEDRTSSCFRSKPFWIRRRCVRQASPWVVRRPLPRKWPIRFHLNLGLLVVLRIGLQHMLNDGGIGGDDGLFDAAKIEPECVAEGFACTSSKPAQDCGPSRANPQRIGIGKQRVSTWTRSDPSARRFPWSDEESQMPRLKRQCNHHNQRLIAQEQVSFPNCFKSSR